MNQFAAKAFPVIGKAKKSLVARSFTPEQADAILSAKGPTLGARFSTACALLKTAA